jgi:hypothetical protein
MYSLLITIHSFLRWLVILAAAYALVRAYRGWLGRRPWTAADRRAGTLFTSLFDLQVLVGLILYFFASPITRAFLTSLGAGLENPVERYFGVVHIGLLLLAVLIAHAGSAISRNAQAEASRHRIAALLFSLSILIVLFAIPWPFSVVPRPWIRLG